MSITNFSNFPQAFSHLIFAGGDVFMGPRVSVTFTEVRFLLWALRALENGPVEDVTAENKECQLLMTKVHKFKGYSIHMDHDILCTVRYILNQ